MARQEALAVTHVFNMRPGAKIKSHAGTHSFSPVLPAPKKRPALICIRHFIIFSLQKYARQKNKNARLFHAFSVFIRSRLRKVLPYLNTRSCKSKVKTTVFIFSSLH
jgi:hypothetical protein